MRLCIWVGLLATTMFVGFAAASPDDDAKAAIAIALALHGTLPGSEFPDYADGCKLAIKERKPLVVFVNCKARKIEGVVVCVAPQLYDNAKSRVVIGKFDAGRGYHYYVTELGVTATDKEIRDAINPPVVVIEWSPSSGCTGNV